MKSEVREAAERRRARTYDDHKSVTYPAWSKGMQDDLVTLADAWLAANPADGETPVDADWLKLCGAEYDVVDDGYQFRDEHGCRRLFLQDAGGSIWLAETGDMGNNWPDDIHARQQVRDLCRCLGIPLPEEARTNG